MTFSLHDLSVAGPLADLRLEDAGVGQVRECQLRRTPAAPQEMELTRIGVNLNQVSRALNAGAPAPAGTPEAVERVGELVAALLAGEV